MENLDFKELPGIYKNVRKTKSYDGLIFSSLMKGDYLEVYYLGKGEYRFIIDNFPFPRRFYSTNVSYRTIEDFEFDLIRMNVEIPAKFDNVNTGYSNVE